MLYNLLLAYFIISMLYLFIFYPILPLPHNSSHGYSTDILYLYQCVCLSFIIYVVIESISFSAWLISLSTVPSESIHVFSSTNISLFYPMDCSLPGSSVCGIFQARILEWSSSSGDLLDPGIKPDLLCLPVLAIRFFTTSVTWEAPSLH